MNSEQLKERVYDLIRERIRRRIDPAAAATQNGSVQQAINNILVNIAILATNKRIDVAIDYLYEALKDLLAGVSRENVSDNALMCLEKFRVEIHVFREMHRLLDSQVPCEVIFRTVEHHLATEAKELIKEPGAEPTPSLDFSELELSDEGSFIARMTDSVGRIGKVDGTFYI